MALVDRVAVDERRVRDPGAWYFAIPAIAHLREHGVALDGRATILIGENGSGKSTFVEAVADAWRRRIPAASRYWGAGEQPEDADLHWAMTLQGTEPVSHGGCFLRAEAMHQVFGATARDEAAQRLFSGPLNARSHGEGFLAFLHSRLSERGLFILDEPEAALSFTSCLQLLALMDAIANSGSQLLLATHSPLLAALPGATILEFNDGGIETKDWEDLELVQHWRSFLNRPQSYLRHLSRSD